MRSLRLVLEGAHIACAMCGVRVWWFEKLSRRPGVCTLVKHADGGLHRAGRRAAQRFFFLTTGLAGAAFFFADDFFAAEPLVA